MIWIALKMLTGNTFKYLAIVMGITFSAFLIAQQASIFCGLMLMTTSQILDINGADVWVMDRNVQYIDDLKPMSDSELFRVRGVPGVDWAVRLYRGITRARLADGNYQQIIMIGLDDATLVGAPHILLHGNLTDLRMPDAVIMDDAGYKLLWPDDKDYQLGKTFEMNDRRAVLVGVCVSRRTFTTFPIVYTRYSQATLFVPQERKVLSFVLANSEDHLPVEDLCRRIEDGTGLQALTRDQFFWKTITHYMTKTGIPINFGMTVILGFLVGTAVSGMTFYLFTVENIKQFGALKAMGLGNLRLMGMILFQAALVGFVGYGLGMGMAALFGTLAKGSTHLAFFMPWHVLVGTGAAVVLIVMLSSVLSLWRVLVLEPAVVFQG